MIRYSRTVNNGVHALRLEKVVVVETDGSPLFTIAREHSIKLIIAELNISEDVRLKLIINKTQAYFELDIGSNDDGEIENYWSSEHFSYRGKACFNTVESPHSPAISITFDIKSGKSKALTDRLEAMINTYNKSIETELAMEREEFELLYHQGSVLTH